MAEYGGFGRGVEAQVDFGGDAGCAGDIVGVGDIQKGVFQRKRAVLLSVARGKVSEGLILTTTMGGRY